MEMKTQLDEFCTYETTKNVQQSIFSYEFPLKAAKDLEILEQNLCDPNFFSDMVKTFLFLKTDSIFTRDGHSN